MSSHAHMSQSPNRHSKVLGGFWIVYGLIRLLMVVCLLIYGRTATLMFGAILSRVPDPFALMEVFHVLYTCLIALSAICGLMGFVAGMALVGEHRSGRIIALIAAVLSLSDIPLGTSLGIYTLVALLPIGITDVYGRSGESA
jgi:hypothetical protein